MNKNVSFDEASKLVSEGKIGVMPTDTLYGLVARADDTEAVKKLYRVKKREDKPGTVIAASIEQLVELGLKARYLKAVENYWPNPISIVIPTGSDLEYLHRGRLSLAVRIPADEKLRHFLNNSGVLLTSSANMPGKEPAKNLEEAKKYFGDLVDFYVDGGELSGKPSTVIRIVDDAIEVLRKGSVKIDEETGRIEE